MKASRKWSLLGVADHEGVKHVGGRLGAALGPESFIQYLGRLQGLAAWKETLIHQQIISDSNHDIVSRVIGALQKKSDKTVIVGGGNDHAYSQVKGIIQTLSAKQKLSCINIDAHFDLRPYTVEKMSSGSPFRRLIEENWLHPSQLIEFGIQELSNHKDLWNYAKNKKIKTITLKEIQKKNLKKLFEKCLKDLSQKNDWIVICIDLDVVNGAEAPGVSAPGVQGLSSSDLLMLSEIAGFHPKVCSLGVYELNPLHDPEGRTARLAATTVAQFISSWLLR